MNPAQHLLIFAVRLYRWTLSPAKTFLFGPLGQCRFEPSCSTYAIEAVQKHGSARGSFFAMRRICRCHPWGGCGWDPVPDKCQAPCVRHQVEEAAETLTPSGACRIQ